MIKFIRYSGTPEWIATYCSAVIHARPDIDIDIFRQIIDENIAGIDVMVLQNTVSLLLTDSNDHEVVGKIEWTTT